VGAETFGATGEQGPAMTGRSRIAYVMSRFPKLTETFVLFEILAVEEAGRDVEIYPLLRERQPVMHEEAEALVARAHYLPFLSLAILRSQLHYLVRRPRRYVGALWATVRGTWGSRNFFFGGLGIFPKVTHMARLMEADRIAHVHCHFASHPALAGFVIHRLTDIPFSFTAHGSDVHVDRHMLCQKVAEAAFVVAISEYNRDVIARECAPTPTDGVVVIHTGVDTSHFRPRPPLSGADDRPFTIACVGTLHEVKGQAHLIQACARLVASGIDVACHLVGDGPDRPMLERAIADAGLSGRVVLRGLLDRAALASLLASCDVLVAPSVPTAEGKREGIPVVLMEGMCSGLPVVASRLSGIPELVVDGVSGLLVEPGDDAGLAEALTRLHGDPALRQSLADRGREAVIAEFDIRRNGRRLVERIDQAALRSPLRRPSEAAPYVGEPR
jgi:glycosyltransferase involved in cell wall biosynthesis